MNSFCQKGDTIADFNLGFEKITTGKDLPDGWFIWGNFHHLKSDSVEKHHGKYSMLIEAPKGNSNKEFTCIARTIPAIYKGKEIELKAYLKYKDVADGYAGLILRIDGASGNLQIDNMSKRGLQGTADWKLY